MLCAKCGAQVAEGAGFCPACGQPTSPAPSVEAGMRAISAQQQSYAGFWLRFFAIVIDFIILSVALGIPLGVILRAFSVGRGMSPQDIIAGAAGTFALFELIGVFAQWLYFALLESSSWQATLGKKALGLEVTGLDGRRVSFGRATGRYFAKIISGLILLIGYLMAGFTEKKQALHDMIAGTLVLKKV